MVGVGYTAEDDTDDFQEQIQENQASRNVARARADTGRRFP